jgi:hypothetical protein
LGLALLVSAAAPLGAQSGAPAPAKAERPLPPGANEPIAQGEGRAIAEKLASQLEQNFVYPEQARRYAAMLRSNLAAGRYDAGTRIELARRLTDDLQAVQKDGHLHVELRGPERQGGADRGPPPGAPPLIQSARTIAPGIAYIRFTAFLGRDEELAAIRKWLADNRDAKTLIFDLRNHHGGGVEEQNVIFPYLYSEKTPLVKMAIAKRLFDERGSPLGDGPTMEREVEGDQMVSTHYAIPGEATPLRDAKVYLLVSNATASAAEHFSLALKSTGRATLIGEATAGANHFGGPEPLNEHFAVWMPVGRTYDIKTGKDWEGDGIAPDIAVDPTQALIVALEKAGLSHEQAVALDATEVPAEPVHRDKLKAR